MLTVSLFAKVYKTICRILGVLPASCVVGVLPAVVGTCLGCKCGNESARLVEGELHGVDGWLLAQFRGVREYLMEYSSHGIVLLILVCLLVMVRKLIVCCLMDEVKRLEEGLYILQGLQQRGSPPLK
jgi:hypothetical protein